MSAARILVVEDNLVVAKAMQMQLFRHGFLVDIVTEASHAKAAVRGATPPDLILLDVGLPTHDPGSPIWDGVDFLEWLHWMNIEIPVIIHSSTAPQVIQQRLRAATAAAYFQKPAKPQEIIEAIRAALPPPKEEEQPAADPAPPEAPPAPEGTEGKK